MNHDPIASLRSAGIRNPLRLVQLLRRRIASLELDLSGLTVLTEAASGPYVVTPVLAAMAGAERIIALTHDSGYASATSVMEQTQALEALCGLAGRIEIHTQRSPELFACADIVTNLGFVRPIDAEMVAAMKQDAVVALMYEAWELRQGDVDIAACRDKGIPVLATNEDHPTVDVFTKSGLLCLKMLLSAQIEVHHSNILVVGSDKFAAVIERQLSHSGARSRRIETLRFVRDLDDVDAVVVADFTREDVIIGRGGDITVQKIALLNPAMTVIPFAGIVDVPALLEGGITVFPEIGSSARRMTMTLADIGPGTVVDLHAAGLKVGELTIRERTERPDRGVVSKWAGLSVELDGYRSARFASVPIPE